MEKDQALDANHGTQHYQGWQETAQQETQDSQSNS
jgi:hypothetical protein